MAYCSLIRDQAATIHKRSAEDTSFTIENEKGEKKTILVPAGSHVSVDIAALHYNRETFS